MRLRLHAASAWNGRVATLGFDVATRAFLVVVLRVAEEASGMPCRHAACGDGTAMHQTDCRLPAPRAFTYYSGF